VSPDPRIPAKATPTWRAAVGLGLLLVLTALVYEPVRTHEFINFDDGLYVQANPRVQGGFTWESIRWAFTTAHASNWHPLTWLSHMLDCRLFGLNAGAHHLTNVVLHGLNTWLLWWLWVRLTGAPGRSLVVAGLFALHPLHVESVAWVAERKDVLSALFGLLTLLAYERYARRRAAARSATGQAAQSAAGGGDSGKEEHGHSRSCLPASPTSPGRTVRARGAGRAYTLALVCFALGLMSKPMLVTLPFVMLLLDYWPLRRIPGADRGNTFPFTRAAARSGVRLAVEKLPFFALAAASSTVTYLVQERTGAVASLEIYPFSARVMNAVMAYLTYLGKMLWPANLSVIYLPPEQRDPVAALLAVVALGAVTGWVLWQAAKRAWLAVGWFWYLGMLVPVIGLVQVGNQAFADRYMYLPSVGLSVGVVWLAWEWAARRAWARVLAQALAAGALLGYGWAARQQVRLWRDSETLFTHGLRVTRDNFILHNNLGTALLFQGRYAQAKPHYEEALRLRPLYAEALNNLGVLLTREGRVAEALPLLERAVRLAPKRATVYAELAVALAYEGRWDDAVDYYRRTLALQPDCLPALNNLAWIHATHPEARYRNGAEAVRLAEEACRLTRYQRAIFVGTLAAAYAEAGRFVEALATAEKAEALARAAGDARLAEKNRELAALYRAGRPYRETPPVVRPSPAAP